VKILPARQVNSPQARIADSSSRNAVSFSPARTNEAVCIAADVRLQQKEFYISMALNLRMPSAVLALEVVPFAAMCPGVP